MTKNKYGNTSFNTRPSTYTDMMYGTGKYKSYSPSMYSDVYTGAQMSGGPIKVAPSQVGGFPEGLAGSKLAGVYGAVGTKVPQTKTGPGWMGKGGYLDTGASVVGALSGLASAYTGYKGLQLAEDEFEFNKALSQTNLANQAKLINEQRLNAGNVGLALAGNTMSEADRTATRSKITAGNVAGKI